MVFGGGSRRLEVLLELRDKFSAQMKQAGSGLDKFNDSLKAARPVLLGITGAVAGVGVVSVKLASDLEEARNKANVTFGQASQAVQAFAATSGRSFGISQRAANEYTATLGNILQASGLSQKATADMSVELTKLAADLASFNNLPIDEALLKLRSGLVGQAEPLRAVGVLLSENAVQAKAMELGLADVSGELSEGAKVQARYALILEQTKTAQGDFTRTSAGLANQMRIAKAQMEDAAATLGTTLLPVATKAIGVVNRLVQEVAGLPQGLQTAGIAIAGATGGLAALGLVIPPLVTGVSSLGKVMTAAGTAMKALIPVLAGVNASMLGVVGVIGAIAIAGTLLWALFRTREESDKVVVSQDKLVASMRKLQSAAGGAGEALGDMDAAVQAIRESLASAGHEVTLFGANNETIWSRNQETVAQAAQDMVAVVEQYGITLDKLQPALEGLGLSHEQLAPLIEAASANTARLNEQTRILQTTFKTTADAAATQTRDIGNLDQKLRDFSETTRTTTFSQERLMELYRRSSEQLSIYEGVASLAAESVWNIGRAVDGAFVPASKTARKLIAELEGLNLSVKDTGDTFFESGEHVEIFRARLTEMQIAGELALDPLKEMADLMAQDVTEAAKMARDALMSFQAAGEMAAGGIAVGMRVLLGEITSVNQGIANIKLPGGQTVGGLATVAPFPWEFRDVAPPGAVIAAGPSIVTVNVAGSVFASDLASIIAREMREIERRGM